MSREKRRRRKRKIGHQASLKKSMHAKAAKDGVESPPVPSPGQRPVPEVDSLKTRRAFIEGVSTLALAVLGSAFGNVISTTWDRHSQRDSKVDYFFFLYDTEQYRLAFNVALDLLSGLPRNSPELVRWLNNMACAAAWDGKFQDARNLLIYAKSNASSWWMAVAESNLAYVQYHLGNNTRSSIPRIEQAVHVFSGVGFSDQRWLQLWSRQPAMDLRLIPPFGVLLRLYAKEGRLQDAFAIGEADIRFQGYRAQGSRVLLGLIANPLGLEKTTLRYADQVQEEYNPTSSWLHMEAENNLIVSHLTRKALPDETGFIGQAKSIKSEYYSWTTLADIKYFLSPNVSSTLRNEYGQRIVASYQQAGQAELDAIIQIGDLVR